MARRAARTRLFGRGSRREAGRIAATLRTETFGGALLLGAAVLALAWANSPWGDGYEHFRDLGIGPSWLHLHLSVSQWAGDGLLALFFFVAGLELKRELVAGELRNPRRAAVPVAAAVGGVVAPASIYLVLNAVAANGSGRGWAIPTATDIAFALAALAVIGSHLPAGLRTFLLTLAVVDDLIAIVIIAIWYSGSLQFWDLGAALVTLAAFALLVRSRARWVTGPLLVLAVLTWALVHASGVHATVAGVLLAFVVPVRARGGARGAEALEHRWRPVSAAIAVPGFALTGAGVTIGGWHGLTAALSDPVAYGVVAGLLCGKVLGVFGATYLTARFTGADLDPELQWVDVFGLAMLCGIGFTVSLLIGELAYGQDSVRDDLVRVAVLVGSLSAALVAAVLLRLRERAYRRLG